MFRLRRKEFDSEVSMDSIPRVQHGVLALRHWDDLNLVGTNHRICIMVSYMMYYIVQLIMKYFRRLSFGRQVL